MKTSHAVLVALSLATLIWSGTLDRGSAQEPGAAKPKPPVPELIVAVRHGDHARIKDLLANGADPNVKDPGASPPNPAWGWAVLLGDDKSLALLREKGIAIDPILAWGALNYATERGNTALTRLLIDKAFTADANFGNRMTPLTLAAGSGNREMVGLLLEKGADPNFKIEHADTALMAAARTGNVEIICALLAKHADVEAKDPAGRTALLWAVRSDSVDAVKAVLEAGADVNAADKAGGTALTLAARRANAEVVELLRKKGAQGNPSLGAGAPTSPRAAVEKSLPLLQRGADSWLDRTTCISCHHQGMIVSTAALAKERGFPIDERLARRQVETITGKDHRFNSIKDALKSVDSRLRADFSGSLPLRAGLFLSALVDAGWEPDNYTEVAARVVAESQWVDGRWNHGIPRSPIESSDFAATAFAVRVLPVYAPKEQAKAIAPRLARAKEWLVATPPRTTDDKSFRLFGLHWSGADAAEINKAARQLLADQRPDGGWAQLPEVASDAYATGQVLVALHQAGGLAVTEEAYQRGVKYLLRTQEDDGSWLVSSRSIPANEFFESGYPHGKFQFISFAGSCWATRALCLAAAPPAEENGRP
jgi:ankyrin repeat protein